MFLCIHGTGLCRSVVSAAMADPVLDRFHALDGNGDGQVSWEEFHAVSPNISRKGFDMMDSDGSGSLCESEWAGFMSNHGMEVPASMKSMTMPARDAARLSPRGRTRASGRVRAGDHAPVLSRFARGAFRPADPSSGRMSGVHRVESISPMKCSMESSRAENHSCSPCPSGASPARRRSRPEPCFRGSDFNTECNVSNVIPCRERFRKIMRWS